MNKRKIETKTTNQVSVSDFKGQFYLTIENAYGGHITLNKDAVMKLKDLMVKKHDFTEIELWTSKKGVCYAAERCGDELKLLANGDTTMKYVTMTIPEVHDALTMALKELGEDGSLAMEKGVF
jgi:hypothetical protein